jgi:endoglucanase
MFTKLNDKFIVNKYPVIIGEYGATNKNNLEERLAWFDFFLTTAKSYGIPCCLWDNAVWEVPNGSTDYSEHYGYYNRKAQTWYFPEIINQIVESTK